MSTDVEQVIARAREGDPKAYEGEWEVMDQRFVDRTPEVLVSKSLRLSLASYEQVRAIAARRRVSPSSLMRQWIEEGVVAAQEEAGHTADPVSLVDRLQTDVARLARAIHKAA